MLASRRTNLSGSAAPGTVLGTTPNGGIQVVCGDGNVIELLRLRREDGVKCWFAEDSRFAGNLME